MSISGIKPGIGASRCSRGAPSGHQPHDFADQSGRRPRIGHGSPGGEGISFPSDPGDRYPTGSTPSRFDRSAGSAGRMQLLTDRVCIELLMPGLSAFRPSFRIWRCLLAVLMGRNARWTRLATFRTVRVPVRC